LGINRYILLPSLSLVFIVTFQMLRRELRAKKKSAKTEGHDVIVCAFTGQFPRFSKSYYLIVKGITCLFLLQTTAQCAAS